MNLFEMIVAEASISHDGGPYAPLEGLTYSIPDEAEEMLEPIRSQYGQSPFWYFDKLNYGWPPAPWVIACLDREYDLAGHVATSRHPASRIWFSPYQQVPSPAPSDCVPKVGVVVFATKEGIHRSKEASPIFKSAWNALAESPTNRR